MMEFKTIAGAAIAVGVLGFVIANRPQQESAPPAPIAAAPAKETAITTAAVDAAATQADVAVVATTAEEAAAPAAAPTPTAAPTLGTAVGNLEMMQNNPKDWVMQNGNYASQRYSSLAQINRDNVKDLQVAWSFSTGVLRGHEGGPLVIGDVMYIHTPFPNKVFALDLKDDGRIIWKYEPRQDSSVIPVMCCDTVNRGVAYGDGKIFLYQADTTLVALNAKTGEKLWSVSNGDPSKGETGTAAPMVVKDKVYVGISGGEFGVRGHLTAYNIADG
ncbi:MAG: PQQ-binding-like beta-propeller repeat protein, partial [Thiohalocapsa sp.]